MASNSDTVLVIMAGSAPVVHFSKLPKRLAKELDLVRKLEAQAAGRAIRMGLWLYQVQFAVKGKFKAWLAENVQELRYRQCAYYMRLTHFFAEQLKAKHGADTTKRLLDALSSYHFGKAPKSKDAREAFAALSAFIGEDSLNELLIKHGIKGVGLKSQLEAGADAPPQLTPAEQLEFIWEQTYTPAKTLADFLTAQATSLPPDKKAVLEAELMRALQALRAS